MLRSTPVINACLLNLFFFFVERATLVKFGLHANDMKCKKQSEKGINVRAIAPVYISIHHVQ